MTSTTPRRLRAPLTLAVTLLLASCGGGHGDGSPETAAAAAPTAAAQAATATPTLTVRARGTAFAGTGPSMTVRVDGNTVGTASVTTDSAWRDYTFTAPTLRAGSRVEVAFTNDASSATGGDRNLFVAAISGGGTVVLPTFPGALFDRGSGSAAFDGQSVTAATGTLAENGALRVTWPTPTASTTQARRREASRFLLQASFGPTPAAIDTLVSTPFQDWIKAQMALPVSDDFVAAVQARYDKGDAYRPGGASYDPAEVSRTFWRTAVSAPDMLRRRTAFALHHIFMISQADGNLWYHSRAYANYLDILNRHAFGNFRALLEEIALSPAMGLYLSHIRNRKEDPATGRLPDENFAREIMQLFTIGLHELETDGSLKRDASGRPIETYGNADVMALAKVFTGYGWAFPDNQLTDVNFRDGQPDYRQANDKKIDLQRMKIYPGQHSTAAKSLFAGKSWAVTIPADASASADLRIALDALFRHPNVGPFISRQLIQQLVTSQPSAAYVGRVAAVFNNNGSGVRGDLGAVVRAILLDSEARSTPSAASTAGKLREPVLGVVQWMRAFGAVSSTGAYAFTGQIEPLGQLPQLAPSVFGYFRPGYVPPNTSFSMRNATAPEFQLVNEGTVAAWANTAEAMGLGGLGGTAGKYEVSGKYDALISQLTTASAGAMLDELDILLFGGRMSSSLRQALVDAMAAIGGSDAANQARRVRLAVFLALASPEYRIQP